MTTETASREIHEEFGRKLCRLVGVHEDGWRQWNSFISELSAHLTQQPVPLLEKCPGRDDKLALINWRQWNSFISELSSHLAQQ